MKNASMIVILISALTLTLLSSSTFIGIKQVMAVESQNKEEKKEQVNTERQQINKCENNAQNGESDMECSNLIVYGVVCMPGAQCILKNFEIPFELVTPF